MKHIILILAILFSFASADVTTGVDFTTRTMYVNRGTIFEDGLAASKGTPVIWSDGWISSNGLTATVWSSTMIQDSIKTNEVDLIVGYSKEFYGVNINVGINYYTFPNSYAETQVSSTGEFVLGASKTIEHVTIGATAYKDYLMSKGIYVSPSVKTTWSISDFTINANISVGWADDKFMLYNRSIDLSGMTDASVDVEFKYNIPVVNGLVVGTDMHNSYQPNVSSSNNPGWQGMFYGFGFSYSM